MPVCEYCGNDLGFCTCGKGGYDPEYDNLQGFCHECNELVICTELNKVAENVYECKCGYPNHISQLCDTPTIIVMQ